MEVFDLLERVERRQALIIQQLIARQEQFDLPTLAAQLQLDRSTLRTDLTAIKQVFQQLDDKITLQFDSNQVRLVSTGQISVATIYYQYLQHAVKYQLLLYLLQHSGTSKTHLARHFALSVSTLNRRIHELNDLLTEYDIQIKNGRLVGFESQIRYFYLHLFWFTRPFELNQQEMTGTLIDTVMKKITTQFAQPFTPAGDMCLQIWLYISEKRRHTTELAAVEFFAEPIDFTTTSVKLMKAFSDPYFDQYLFEHNRNERTLLYMFVQGGLVLDTHNHDAQSFISDVAQQNGVRQLNQRFIQITQQYFDFDQLAAPFKRYLIDTLTQIHYNFIHFHGLFHMTQQQPAVTLNSYLAAVYQRLLQPEVGTTAVFTKYLSWRYLPLLYLMMHASQVHLRVGCDFAVETSLASVLINQIRGALPANIKVELRRYHAGSKYDVVLTDMCKGYQEVSTDQIFIFLNLQNEVDLPPLATFLTDHYFNKLFK